MEATSWLGGFWERMVQLVKQILRKILGKQKLNYKELLMFVMEAGPNLDKNIIRPSDPALFYENYTKLSFDPKHEKIGLNRGWYNLQYPFF